MRRFSLFTKSVDGVGMNLLTICRGIASRVLWIILWSHFLKGHANHTINWQLLWRKFYSEQCLVVVSKIYWPNNCLFYSQLYWKQYFWSGIWAILSSSFCVNDVWSGWVYWFWSEEVIFAPICFCKNSIVLPCGAQNSACSRQRFEYRVFWVYFPPAVQKRNAGHKNSLIYMCTFQWNNVIVSQTFNGRFDARKYALGISST